MGVSRSSVDTNASMMQLETPVETASPSVPVTIVRENPEIPQPPLEGYSMNVDEVAIDEVVREAEGDDPSPADAIKKRAFALSRSCLKIPMRP